jgi:hypothetical protein
MSGREIRLLAPPAQRVGRQMASRRPHLRVIYSSRTSAMSCGSQGCVLGAVTNGLCAPCLAVYATVEVLYRRLVARDMARLELRTPGIGCAAMAALQARLATLDPPVAAGGEQSVQWTPEEWELDRLDAFLAELRGLNPTPPGEGA